MASQNQAKSVSNTSLSSSTQSCLQNLLQETELLRSSRGRQLEEARLHTRRLEQEVWRSRETVAAVEECNQSLKREQADMRKKVEEARQAIASSMEKVKELESAASQVPALQRHVLQLESQIRFCR